MTVKGHDSKIDERNIIWLDLFEFLTYHKKVKILSVFPKGYDIKKSFLSKIPLYYPLWVDKAQSRICVRVNCLESNT